MKYYRMPLPKLCINHEGPYDSMGASRLWGLRVIAASLHFFSRCRCVNKADKIRALAAHGAPKPAASQYPAKHCD